MADETWGRAEVVTALEVGRTYEVRVHNSWAYVRIYAQKTTNPQSNGEPRRRWLGENLVSGAKRIELREGELTRVRRLVPEIDVETLVERARQKRAPDL